MRKGGGVAARGEGSVDVGGREREEAEAAGFPARRSQFRPGIYPINFCSVEWQRARQFGSASAILTLYRNSAGHEEAARAFPPLLADPTAIIVDRPPPPPPTIISLSLSPSTEIFVVFLFECTRITWPNTLPAEFLRPSFHRVEYLFGRLIALVPPRSPPLRARVISPRGRCVEEDRSMMNRLIRFVFFSRFSKIHCFRFRFSEFCYILRTMKYNMRCYL